MSNLKSLEKDVVLFDLRYLYSKNAMLASPIMGINPREALAKVSVSHRIAAAVVHVAEDNYVEAIEMLQTLQQRDPGARDTYEELIKKIADLHNVEPAEDEIVEAIGAGFAALIEAIAFEVKKGGAKK